MVSDINVAPFVDVMLVLVVIFMLTAPLLTVGVPVDLPQASASPIREETEPLVLSIDRDSRIFLMDSEVEQASLAARLAAMARANPALRVFVRGDRTISYGRIMEVMGMVSESGFTKVALIAEVPVATPGASRRP
ncbi:MAG: protein TolR [Alphaproteobacteria bacterium]|nr:protein TolR [Alphaproteobacteria bacterium]